MKFRFYEDGGFTCDDPYVASWGDDKVCLDDSFTIEQLEEIIALMKEQKCPSSKISSGPSSSTSP